MRTSRRLSRSWSSYRRGLSLIIGVFLLGLPLLNWSVVGGIAGGDPEPHYAYVRSVVMDNDLQFENELRHRYELAGIYALIRQAGTDKIIHSVDPNATSYKDDPRTYEGDNWLRLELFKPRTKTGHVPSIYAVGTPLLWLPFFVLGHGITLAINALGGAVPADGYSLPYTIAVSLGSAILVLLGMLLTYDVLTRFTRPLLASAAVILILLASPLFAFAYQAPISAHGPAMFVASLFIFVALHVRSRPSTAWFAVWGLVGGLMIITRIEPISLFTLPALVAAVQLYQAIGMPDTRVRLARWVRCYAAFTIGLIVGVLPQLIAGMIIWGEPLLTFYPAYFALGGGTPVFNWLSPHWWDVMWSTNKGIFVWHPILLVSLAGLVLLLRRDRILAIALLGAFFAQVYIIGTFDYYHGLTGFGQRYFVNLAPAFMIGMAWLVDFLQRRFSLTVLTIMGSLFVVWNFALFIQYGIGLIPRNKGFEWGPMLYNQFVIVPRLVWKYLVVPFKPWSYGALLLLGMAIIAGYVLFRHASKVELL